MLREQKREEKEEKEEKKEQDEKIEGRGKKNPRDMEAKPYPGEFVWRECFVE